MVIPLNGLAQGRSVFRWRADKAFFSGFENSEILDADILVDASVQKSGSWIGIDCTIKGTVTLECDRCLEDLVLPVDVTALLSVKSGRESDGMEVVREGDREIVWLPEDNTELDLSQIVYDYTCLSLPMLKVHPDGQCNPDTVRFICKEAANAPKGPASETDSPFAALKDLLESKK